MSFHRRAILVCLTIALGAVAGRASADEPSNSISNITVKQGGDGRWVAQFDYFFNGEPADALLQIDITRKGGQSNDPNFYVGGGALRPEAGSHHGSVPVNPLESVTARVQVSLVSGPPEREILIRQQIFADLVAAADAKSATTPAQALNERDLAEAIRLIDDGADLQRARGTLEKIIARDARFEAAYIELARIAMKTNWGPDGLHQAELLLDSALKIRPDSVNAKILMGYVYAHQARYPDAQKLFADAARSDPPNLWLWANWGESLVMQGKDDEAIRRYREAVARPSKHDTYARARLDAYQNLLKLLAKRGDADGMEALYKQHSEDAEQDICINTDYARFMLTVRGNARRAIEVARDRLDVNCGRVTTREVTGLANYLIWAQSKTDDGLDALNQARIFLPAGARTFYLLASSEQTMPAARKLIGAGESIDQKDNERMTALSQALQAKDADATTRLLTLGAHADALVGPEDMPVALLPVFTGDLDSIRVLRRAGVDYTKISYAGLTAPDFARRSGDTELLQALTGKPKAL